MENVLSITTFIPLIGAAILAIFLRGEDEAAQRNAKWVALATTTVTFFVSLFMLFEFDPNKSDLHFVEVGTWLMGLLYKF